MIRSVKAFLLHLVSRCVSMALFAILPVLVGLACTLTNSQPYKVAIVTPNHENDAGPVVARIPPGPLILRGFTLADLIRRAYGETGFKDVEGPDWVNADRWNLRLETEPTFVSTEQHGRVLWRALEDRFGLKTHRQLKLKAVYKLTLVATGSGLRPDPFFVSADPERRFEPGSIHRRNISMAEFADMLSLHLRRPVLNDTNLRGLFRVKLDWSPDADPLNVSKVGSDPEKRRPSLSQALEQQLGLRLTAGQSRVEIIVVERAEKPRSH